MTVSVVALLALPLTLVSGASGSEPLDRCQAKGGAPVTLKSPESLKREHAELHAELLRATRAGGETGKAAKAVARLLHAHFEKEEQYALPPLGLLPALAEGKVTPEMAGVLESTDRLKAELPQMLKEHEEIVGALNRLAKAAKDEDKTEYVHFAEKLKLHAQTEEQVMYPAAVLVGEYLKLKLKK
jgi:hypothetical protein